MKLTTCLTALLFTLVCFTGTHAAHAADVTVVKNGKAVVSGIYLTAEDNAKSHLQQSVKDFVYAVEKMTGATLPVIEAADKGAVPAGPAIVLGELAEQFGFTPPEKSLWIDSMRTVRKDGRIYVVGESPQATAAAVMDLLHEAGVRWFLPQNIPGNPGEVIPTSKNLVYSEQDFARRPVTRSRRLWGPNLGIGESSDLTKWGRRNHAHSPIIVRETHAWGHLIAKEDKKPELYAIKRYNPDGTPVRGGQLCVSHPEVAGLAAKTLIKYFREHPESISHSISPNDGGGQCICRDCEALDPPNYLEPSSAKPALSDRYIYFYNKIAEEVAKEFPDRFLAFYVYSDYSRAPIKYTELHPMLLPVFAPIRYPRMQSMENPNSEQNIRLKNEIAVYAKYASHIGYYGYNFNLAETTVPFSKISIWKDDLSYLREKGLTHISLETLGNWNTNGPHIYLGARYPYSGEDPDAIMDDYYTKLGGAAAKPIRAYWEAVDRAYVEADVQSGSYFGIELIMTETLLNELQGHLDQAAKLAKTEREKAVVAFFQSGLDQGKLVNKTINHLNSAEFLEAKAACDQLIALNSKLQEQHVVSIYPNRYLNWFITHVVNSGAAIPESGGKIATVLPNTWEVRMDYYNVGADEEWFRPTSPSSHWQTAKMWGGPSLYSQGFGDFMGYQWFRVQHEVPAENADKMVLWFGSNDGTTRLWINGEPVPFFIEEGKGENKKTVQVDEWKRGWRAFSVPVGKFLKPGQKNTITVRIGHHSLNDLNLGGILRPVLLYVPGEKEMQEIEDTYEKMLM